MKKNTLTDFENNYFSSNVDKFPIIYITFTGKQSTDDEFAEYIHYLDLIYTQDEKFVMLTDSSKGNYMKSKHRIDFGNWTKKNREVIQNQCKGIAFVMSSILMKIMLQGIFLIQSLPYEYTIVDSVEKAEEWVKEQLEK